MSEETYLAALKNLVLELLDREKYAVFLFGGRAKGRTGRAVDVDIGILGESSVPLELMCRLYEAVDDSIIPLKVDFVDFHQVSDSFKKTALTKIEIWNQPNTIKINAEI